MAATLTKNSDARSDDEIQKEVLAELAWDPRVNANEIGITVRAGVVTLTGSVESLMMRWAAEEAAHRVRGVRAVANDIDVRLPIASERTDADIATAAAIALESNVVLDANDIRVTVSSGWITLKGAVEWNFQRDDAERVVRSLWGVRGVTNVIEVRARPILAKLKKQIKDALSRNAAESDATQIEIDARGTKVVLKGRVRNWAEREEAERVVWAAPGVTAVENLIVVAS